MTVTPFQAAFANEKADGDAQAKFIADKATSHAVFEGRISALYDIKNPFVLFAVIMMTIFSNSNPNDEGNIFGQDDLAMGITSKALRANGDASQTTAALQNLSTCTGTKEPTDASGLISYEHDLDSMLDALGANPDSTGLQDANLQQVLGGTSPNSSLPTIKTYLLELRNMINDTGDAAKDLCYNGGASAYFDPNDATKMQSFTEMKTGLAQKGLPKNCQKAADDITKDINILGSQTQSTGASLNEIFSQQTNQEKSEQAAFTSFVKSWIDLLNAVIQNTTKS